MSLSTSFAIPNSRAIAMPLSAYPGLSQKRWTPAQLDAETFDLRQQTGVQTDGALLLTADDKESLQAADANAAGLQPGSGDLGISVHVRLAALPASEMVIIDTRDSGNASGYAVAVDSSGDVTVYFGDGSASILSHTFTDTNLSATTWHHLAVNLDRSGNATVSVDGTASAQSLDISAQSAAVNNADPFRVGVGYNGSGYFGGRVDSLVVCNELLTAAEITYLDGRILSELGVAGTDGEQLSAAGKVVSGYNFDELSGTRFDYFGSADLTGAFGDIIGTGIKNGGFETAGAGGADVFGSWVESAAGSSTITEETTDVHAGSSAAKITTDASNSNTYVYQDGLLQSGKQYTLSAFAKRATAVTTAMNLQFGIGAGFSITSHELTDTYTQYSKTGSTTAATRWAMVGRSTNGVAGQEILIDSVTLQSAEILSAPGISAGQAVDGDTITTWTDQSGQSNDFSQSTVSKRFTYDLLSGVYELAADGTDDYMTAATAAAYKPATFGLRIKPTNFSATRTIVGSDTASGLCVKINTSGQLVLVARGGSTIATSTGTLTAGSYATVVVRYGSAGAYSFRIDGSDAGSGTNSVAIASGKPILGSLAGASEFFLGSIRRAVGATESITDSQAIALEKHLGRN